MIRWRVLQFLAQAVTNLSINLYVPGSVVRLFQTFTDDAGDPAMPDSLTLSILKPDGTSESFDLIDFTTDSPFTGRYYRDYSPSLIGRYFWRWEAPNQAADEGEFVITSRVFA